MALINRPINRHPLFMKEKEILNYIKNNVSDAERQKVVDWVEKSAENQAIYNRLKAESVVSKFKNSNKVVSPTVWKVVISTAAAIALFFGLNHWVDTTNSNENLQKVNQIVSNIEVFADKGENREVTLPDGTIVNLNAKSKITFPSVFLDSVREVTIEGEAFFDVTHNKEKPFIVHAGEVKVKVLGTTFNVRSYPKDKEIQTTLITGKVELTTNNSNEDALQLKPLYRATFNKERKDLKIDEIKSDDIIAWRKGILVFKNTPILEVVADLQRKYDVQIEVISKELLTYEYTGTFGNLSLEEVLDMLKVSSPITYKTQNNKIMLEEQP